MAYAEVGRVAYLRRLGIDHHRDWSFEYAIDRADGLHCADVSTVQVVVSGQPMKAQRLPEELRMVLETAKEVAGT